MSLESGKKLGLIASLLNVILPIIGGVGAVAFFVAIIATAASRVGTGTAGPAVGLFSFGLVGFGIAMLIVAVIGFILFMIAMHNLANYYHEPGIFSDILYAFIITVVGVVVAVGLFFAFVLSAISGISPNTPSSTTVMPFLTGLFAGYFVFLIVVVVFAIVNGVLYMRAFNKLAEKSGVDSFKTAGLLFLIGTLPIVGVGGLVSWIGWIFAFSGFRKLKPTAPPSATGSYYTQAPLSGTLRTKYCPNCGTENQADALYCRSCGKPLQ
jgi:uncharacterized membrane protein